jgi:hypothetical protein
MQLSNQKFFDPKSPGFIYAVVVAVLTIIAAAGIQLPKDPASLGADVVTTLSTGGIYALVGILVSSLVFPFYNYIATGGKVNFGNIFSRNATWIALGNAAAAGLALTGFILPGGTVEQLVAAASTKDWMSLISIFALTVGNTLLRFLKEKEAAK